MASQFENVSSDLLWEVVNGQHSKLLKRKQAGGVRFSRDPLNLTNIHSRKYEGFVNTKAIGVQPSAEGKGITLITTRPSKVNKPKSFISTTSFGSQYTVRKTFGSIAASTTKRGYRSDLRHEAIARASAIHQATRQKKETPVKKARGVKAKKAAAAEA